MKFFLALNLLLSVMFPKDAHAFPKMQEAKPRVLKTTIAMEVNPKVNFWIRYFSVDDRERFGRFMDRGAIYKTLIQDILSKQGVPPEFYYLAMIESGFSPHANSWAGAVGIWQFIPSTARMYGLRVDRYVDERRDVIRATHAAARFLKDLYTEFGSWNLAMAAYNSGEGRVRSAIRRAGTKNYWVLARGYLPSETANYVPKFQAAMIICRNLGKYGFAKRTLYEYPKLKKVRVLAYKDFEYHAEKHGMTSEIMKSLNPHLVRWSSGRRYTVWVPTKL